jgi:hypothetical protein
VLRLRHVHLTEPPGHRRDEGERHQRVLRSRIERRANALVAHLDIPARPLRFAPQARAEARALLVDAALEPWRPTLATAAAARRLGRLTTACAGGPCGSWTVPHEHLTRVDALAEFRLNGAARNLRRAVATLASNVRRLPGRDRTPTAVEGVRRVGKETHNGGQGPLFIALDAGTPVVFKPVCVRNETLFAAVIDAIAGRLAPLDLRYPACLPARGR